MSRSLKKNAFSDSFQKCQSLLENGLRYVDNIWHNVKKVEVKLRIKRAPGGLCAPGGNQQLRQRLQQDYMNQHPNVDFNTAKFAVDYEHFGQVKGDVSFSKHSAPADLYDGYRDVHKSQELGNLRVNNGNNFVSKNTIVKEADFANNLDLSAPDFDVNHQYYLTTFGWG